MSQFFHDLEDQLRAAARARSGVDSSDADDAGVRRQPRGPAWLRSGLRATPVLIAVATTIVVAVGALLVLSHGHRPGQSAAAPGQRTLQEIIRSTPRATLGREGSYINMATQQVQRAHRRLCVPSGPPPGPSFIPGSPGRPLLSLLGVLRRPAAPADRAGKREFSGVPYIYASSIRRAFAADGVSYYIAAGRRDSAAYRPSPRCFGLEVAALHADLSRIPASLRASTLRLQSAFISFDSKLLASGPSQMICTATVARHEGGSECGFAAAQIAAGIEPSDDNGTFNGIVPDGVATVTVFWRAAHVSERSATTPVVGNMYALRAGQANGSETVVKVIWRSAQGQVMKTIMTPSARALGHYCSQHPAACVAASLGQVIESSSSSSGASFRGVASGAPSVSESSSSGTATQGSPPPSSGG
jgi:hypothetical protein